MLAQDWSKGGAGGKAPIDVAFVGSISYVLLSTDAPVSIYIHLEKSVNSRLGNSLLAFPRAL